MKIRWSLGAVGILLVLSAAGVTAANAEQIGAANVSPDGFIASLGCGASANLATQSKLATQPQAQPLQTLNTCGSCSSNPCKGAGLNSICPRAGGGWGQCLPPLGNNCTDGTWQCQCWFGPLP